MVLAPRKRHNLGEYNIADHRHRLAAWAASRAASVNGCRFKVSEGVDILEAIGLDERLESPDQLPNPDHFDEVHAAWRRKMIRAARGRGKDFSHGVAAKLINCYLKVKFVCGGFHGHPKVSALHPPIDDLLLKDLVKQNVGGFQDKWKLLRNERWSKFTSHHYTTTIDLIRRSLGKNIVLWKIEKYWKGFQP